MSGERPHCPNLAPAGPKVDINKTISRVLSWRRQTPGIPPFSLFSPFEAICEEHVLRGHDLTKHEAQQLPDF